MRAILTSIWLILTLRCAEADRIRSLKLDGQATRSQRIAERLHRIACRHCAKAYRQLRAVHDGLRSVGREESLSTENGPMPAAARARIARALAGQSDKS